MVALAKEEIELTGGARALAQMSAYRDDDVE